MAGTDHIPPPGGLNIDHVAHFVPDIDAASDALDRAGFSLTPFSAQSHRTVPGGPLVSAGTGNRCVMLRSGYLEFLTPIGDTEIAAQLRNAIRRYVGVHLVAFGTAAPETDHERLVRAGFAPLAPVALQRPIDTPSGPDTARFTVVRVPPGAMEEGRIQYCRHHTPQLLWQERWLTHANHAQALTGVILCVEDPRAAAQRYTRFTGLPSFEQDNGWRIDTARGRLLFADPERLRRSFGVAAPALPWIAGYVLASDNLAASRSHIAAAGLRVDALDTERFFSLLPPALGGLIVFETPRASSLALG